MPPPGLLPEPVTAPSRAEEPEVSKPAPIFFSTLPGGAPPAVPPVVSEVDEAAEAVAPEAPLPHTAVPDAVAGWTLEGDGVSLESLPALLVLGREPVNSEEGASLIAVSGGGTVSKTHAIIRFDGETLTVEDLGSTNGTAVTVAGVRNVLDARSPYVIDADADLRLGDAVLELRRGPRER